MTQRLGVLSVVADSVVVVQLRYNFRLDPTPGQIGDPARAFGCARVVFNDALRLRYDAFRAGEKFLSYPELARKVLTEAKRTPQRAWLGAVSNVVLQQSLRDLDAAHRNFFASLSGKRKGAKVAEPRFKSRKDSRQAIRFTANGFTLRPNGRLYLAKIGEVRVVWSRGLPSDPSSVTVLKDAAGRYHASFVVETDPAVDLDRFPAGQDVTYAESGIDLGLAHFAVLSDGTKIEAPKFLRREEKKLAKLQRALARKEKGSNNCGRAVTKVATAHARVADQRRDFHHKLSTVLVRDNQAIYVEDLCVNGLARTRLAKSVHDAGWSGFVEMLEYKCARYGRYFGRINRFAPTSQVCSACGVKDGSKPLHVRQWTCAGCATVHDRDINAAKNVLAQGRWERLNGCGAQVRPGSVPAPRREAATRRSDRNGNVPGEVGIPIL
jgi:putative transposase